MCIHGQVIPTTLVCMSAETAIHERHFRRAECSVKYPPIKQAAGLSAETMVSVPRKFTFVLSTLKGTP